MTVQERASLRSAAKRIEELRRLHEEAIEAPWRVVTTENYVGIHDTSNIPDELAGLAYCKDGMRDYHRAEETAVFIVATRNLLPVLLAAWETMNLEERLHQVMDVLPEGGVRYKHPLYKEYNQLHKDLEAAHLAYRSALKGVEDE